MSPKQRSSQPLDEGNVYDKIFKQVLEDLTLTILNQFEPIQVKHTQRLVEKFSTSTQREADFLCEVTEESGAKFLLHVEFQSRDDRQMLARMQEYHGMLARKYALPIRHYVFYFGDKPSKMRTSLPKDHVFEGFHLLDFKQMDFHQMLESTTAQHVLLAILTDFKGRPPEAIIRLICTRLSMLAKSEQELKIYLNQLTILSRLRKLDAQTILNISTMPITIDINQDYLYKKGREEGREEGLEKGREEGLEEGLEKGREEEYKLIYMKMHAAGFTALEISTLLDRNLADVTAVIAAGTASTQSESEQGPAN